MTLKINDISFSYNKVQKVLNGVSFEVERAKTTCIMGISGSGKSTLLRIIAGFLSDEKKHLYSDNISFAGKSIDSLRNNGKLSFMFQEPSLLPNLTVRENISLPLRITKKNNAQHIDDIIRSVGLTDSETKLPNALSTGMKVRTALARSFVNFPDLLILDEPFSALDIGWKNSLYNELAELKRKYNTTILMVSHDIEEAAKLSDDILVLGSNGKLIRQVAITSGEFEKSEIVNSLRYDIIREHQKVIESTK